MKVRALALVAVILTAACSPESSLGPTGHRSNDTAPTAATPDKRAAGDSTTCAAFSAGKRSCHSVQWNGATPKR
jgi:hypothetical protein